ncbi:MAG TPA: DUF3473 domain-containing protein, partial [Longimicrobium sp.]|nr:DUF3473 domain-containing protein [Longimicrobium sp.]
MSGAAPVANGLSFDVEDWRQLVHWKMTGEVLPPGHDVVEETDYILEALGARGVRATFFVLANVAQTFPDLVRRIHAAGHEVGSHGWSHNLVYRQTPGEFRDETRRSRDLLQELTGAPVRGYRAAEFSVTRRSWWALEVLAELGFAYDSSVYPISGRRYGVPDAPLEIHRARSGGATITEVPMTAVEWMGRRWPVGGGGYFRLMPYALTARALRHANARGRPAVAYFHPYEFAPRPLRLAVTQRSVRAYRALARNALVHNLSRGRLRARFERMLAEFTFRPLDTLLS